MKAIKGWDTLPEEVKFHIEMTLYDEFNRSFCNVQEYLDEIYSLRDLEDLQEAEELRRKELVEGYLNGEYEVNIQAVRDYWRVMNERS